MSELMISCWSRPCILTWGSTRYVWPIYGTVALWEPPPFFKAIHNLLQPLPSWQTDVKALKRPQCTTHLYTNAGGSVANTKQMGQAHTCSKVPKCHCDLLLDVGQVSVSSCQDWQQGCGDIIKCRSSHPEVCQAVLVTKCAVYDSVPPVLAMLPYPNISIDSSGI